MTIYDCYRTSVYESPEFVLHAVASLTHKKMMIVRRKNARVNSPLRSCNASPIGVSFIIVAFRKTFYIQLLFDDFMFFFF